MAHTQETQKKTNQHKILAK